MSDQGVFQVHRGIFDHPSFAPEPFTEREAWIWLIGMAVWASKRVRVKTGMIELRRGQLAYATRFLAVKWGWHHSRVVRFLNRLKTDTMIETVGTSDATLITICNYDEYQFGRNEVETQTETPIDTDPKRTRNKEEELKHINKEERKEEAREDALMSGFSAFWFDWPNKVGKPAALKAYRSAFARGATIEEILVGIQNYIRDKPPDRPWLNPATFLNQNRWEDRPAAVGAPNGKSREVSAACDNLVELVSRGFGGEPPQDGVFGAAHEADARLLPYRRG